MKACYFWEEDEGTVRVVEKALSAEEARTGYFLNMPCVDTFGRDDQQRYGVFTERGWKHQGLNSFSPRFRAHLLLLGVS